MMKRIKYVHIKTYQQFKQTKDNKLKVFSIRDLVLKGIVHDLQNENDISRRLTQLHE